MMVEDGVHGRRGSSSPRRKFTLIALIAITIVLLVLPVGSAQPSPRFYVDMVYVPQVEKVLVFGGHVAGTTLGAADTIWWWDPITGAWSEGDHDDGPSSRGGASVEVHVPSGKVLVYGGASGPNPQSVFDLPETHLFDPLTGTWESFEFDMMNRPLRGVGHVLGYHAGSDVFVLFGGMSLGSGAFFSDTWHFDLESRRWHKQETIDPPAGRNYVGFDYHPGSDVMVMYGPAEGVYDFNAYLYDPVTRTWRVGAAGPGSGRPDDYSRLVYDHDSSRLVRWGGTGEHAGQVWTYDPESDTWSELEIVGTGPQRVSRHAMTSVPGVGVVVFGGTTGGTAGDDLVNQLWVLDVNAGTWEQR